MNIGKLKICVWRVLSGVYASDLFAPVAVYFAAVAAIVAQLWIFESWVHEINPWLQLPFIQVFADAMLIMMPFVWLRGRWRMTVWVAIAGVTIFCYVNLWYCRAFYDLMPLGSVGMGGNMEGPVIDAFMQMVYAHDWMMLLPTILFGAIIYMLRRRWLRGVFNKWYKIFVPVASLLVWCTAYTWQAHNFHTLNRPDEPFSDTWVRYWELSGGGSYKFTQHLSRLGYVGYWIWQIDYTFFPRTITEAEREQIEQYWREQRESNGHHASAYVHNRDRNLIFIIAESLSADVIDMTVNGVEITPNINGLLRGDTTAILALHMRPQAGHGRSSDGQFIYNTGLLPLRHSVVAKSYPSANYPSIAKALGYKTRFEVIGERPTFYNHSTTNISYGYGKLYNAPTTTWLEDKEIFELALKQIKDAGAPMYVEITTLDMHDPYNKSSEDTKIWEDESIDERDRHYLERAHVFDDNLGRFIKGLKDCGVYENSVVVIASDHEPRKTCLGPDLLSSEIMFVALNTGLRGVQVEQPVGQIDVFPTILDIMGIGNYKYPGLGRSMLSLPVNHGIIDALGNVYGEPDARALERLRRAWDLSAAMIEGRYFR